MNLPQLSDALLVLDQRVATLTFNRDDLRNALTGSALIREREHGTVEHLLVMN